MSGMKCPCCGRVIYRHRRRWYERVLLVKEAYQCNRCCRRRYRTYVLGLMF